MGTVSHGYREPDRISPGSSILISHVGFLLSVVVGDVLRPGIIPAFFFGAVGASNAVNRFLRLPQWNSKAGQLGFGYSFY